MAQENESAQGDVDAKDSAQRSSSLTAPLTNVLVTIVSAAIVSVIGTGLHRSGADINVPWGMVCALGLLGMSTWVSRRRMGVSGVGIHLVVASMVIWWLASTMGPGGDVIVPVGSVAFVTFFSRWSGYIWLVGSLVVQLAVLFFPRRLFLQPDISAQESAQRESATQQPATAQPSAAAQPTTTLPKEGA
jgi:hypothetical protein